MAPLIAALFSQGLSMLGNAVLAKGQAVVEEKLGVKLDIAKPEELRRLEIEHEEWLVEAGIRKAELELKSEEAAQGNVTERWKADMLSDSWLSKNIRPMVLIYLLGAYTVFSIGSGAGFNITQAYVELLAQMLMLVMGAYFVGRSIEKAIDMRERGKQ
jgi:hypothetical protein